jgi:energy-coupling factor transporter ATP-binding protein EcfA2
VSVAPIITFAGVGVTYPGAEAPALHGIDLEILPGEVVGIMGLNGAGKTTLGQCLNGVVPHLRPATVTGRVVVDGRDLADVAVREMAGTVGLVFDNPEYQLVQPTVGEEVALGLEHQGVPSDEMASRVAAVLRTVGLDGLEERSPLALSGGQQQRVAIASVLVMEPRVLFMDEPTSHLDPVGKGEVLDVVRRLNSDQGTTIMVAEHDVEVLAAFTTRIVVLDRGRVALEGPTHDVLGRVEELEALGLRVPQVTAFAHALRPDQPDLPTTVDGALAWLGTG